MSEFQSEAELDEFITRPSTLVIESLRSAPAGFAVLGAGGKMGYHITRMLSRALQDLKRDESIFAVSRYGSPESQQPFEELENVTTIAADLTEAEQVAQLPSVGNVIYLAGLKFGTSEDPELLKRFNITMPQMIAEHYRNARITALSTGNVYSFVDRNSGGATEESETDPPGNYGKSCLGREQAFIDASAKYGTQCCLLRLNYSVALRYGVPVDVAVKVKNGEPVPLEMGYVNLIWQGDAVAHILQSLEIAATPPLILNITGAETVSVRQMAEHFAEKFGVAARFEGTEESTALLSNPARSHQLFGTPEVSAQQILDWTADWIASGKNLIGKPTHFESRVGDF